MITSAETKLWPSFLAKWTIKTGVTSFNTWGLASLIGCLSVERERSLLWASMEQVQRFKATRPVKLNSRQGEEGWEGIKKKCERHVGRSYEFFFSTC